MPAVIRGLLLHHVPYRAWGTPRTPGPAPGSVCGTNSPSSVPSVPVPLPALSLPLPAGPAASVFRKEKAVSLVSAPSPRDQAENGSLSPTAGAESTVGVGGLPAPHPAGSTWEVTEDVAKQRPPQQQPAACCRATRPPEDWSDGGGRPWRGAWDEKLGPKASSTKLPWWVPPTVLALPLALVFINVLGSFQSLGKAPDLPVSKTHRLRMVSEGTWTPTPGCGPPSCKRVLTEGVISNSWVPGALPECRVLFQALPASFHT